MIKKKTPQTQSASAQPINNQWNNQWNNQ